MAGSSFPMQRDDNTLETLESLVRQHVPWEQLDEGVKDSFKNNRQYWEREVCEISIKNQLRWKTGLVRKLQPDERKYYEELVQASKDNLMVFPYHLSDVVIKRLHLTPFQYYTDIMADLITKEKSYDSLPNFTAKDGLRLLGIGRNEYIDRMNQHKSAKNNVLWNLMIRRKTAAVLDLLPPHPIDFNMEPWWIVHPVGITEDQCDDDEQAVLRSFTARKHPYGFAGEYPHSAVRTLYRRALIYLEVPIYEEDYVSVPPLEGFVMNRVQGDYFETLLYKIFVSIDESTNISELSSVLQIDVQMVKDAVSVYCRLGFAIKKNAEIFEQSGKRIAPHQSWIDAQKRRPQQNMAVEYEILDLPTGQVAPQSNVPVDDDDDDEYAGDGTGGGDDIDYDDGVVEDEAQQPLQQDVDSLASTPMSANKRQPFSRRNIKISTQASADEADLTPSRASYADASVFGSSGFPSGVFTPQQQQLSNNGFSRRVGFLFDSTLTAFLMMGNLSLGLKSHAVTMFEVGKLSNESLDSFMDELSKVKSAPISEGDAQRYFDHAVTLYQTLRFLRGELDLDNELLQVASSGVFASCKTKIPSMAKTTFGTGLDLIRYESLSSLDVATRQRVLGKNYDILLSMAPVAADCQTLRSAAPAHLGPPIPEANSLWFKLFVYSVVESGPPTLVLCTGSRLRYLPQLFEDYDELMVTVINRETQILPAYSALLTINELLCSGPLMVQGYQVRTSPSRQGQAIEPTMDVPFPFLPDEIFDESIVQLMKRLDKELSLNSNCGYVRLTRTPSGGWALLDVHFGLPLFDLALNAQICIRVANSGLLQRSELRGRHSRNMRLLSLRFLSFMSSFYQLGRLPHSPLIISAAASSTTFTTTATSWPPQGRIDDSELPAVDVVFDPLQGLALVDL